MCVCPPGEPRGPPGAHHDQPLGDLLGAAVAELPKARPVILLAVQAPILLVVLVGQGGPALAAPAARDGDPLVTRSPSSPCPHRHPVPIVTPEGSQHPSTPRLSGQAASPVSYPAAGPPHPCVTVPRVAAGGSGSASAGWWCGDTGVERAGDTGQGQAWGGGYQPCMGVPAWSCTQRDMPPWSQTCQPGTDT